MTTDLSAYDNNWYSPHAGIVKRGTWYFVNAVVLLNPLIPSSRLKVALLRAFGARVGKGVVIKPRVNIKHPWLLEIHDYTWIGERVWIDNLARVSIGSHCCVSQGALLLCGSHNYKSPSFDLEVRTINIEDGAWIGAKAIVTGGLVGSHAVLAAGSVATSDLLPYMVYQGNPAKPKRTREIVTK